jgi:hypothetical protein
MLGHDTLMNYYKTNFALMQHHKYSLTELESMIPWERFIYVDLLKEHIKEQDQKMRDQAATIKKRR